MKQQFLRLGVVQDRELYQCYTSFLAAKRTTVTGALSATPPTYSEFYSILRQHAELLDSTKRQTRSRTPNHNRRANLASSYFDENFDTTEYDSEQDFDPEFDDDEDGDIQAYLSNQHYDHDTVQHMRAFAAFKQQQSRSMPKDGGIVIPRELYSTLPREFKLGWEKLTADQQQQVSKLGSLANNNTKSSQVQVYKSSIPDYQFIATEDIEDLYSCLRATSCTNDDNESAYDISSLSDGHRY